MYFSEVEKKCGAGQTFTDWKLLLLLRWLVKRPTIKTVLVSVCCVVWHVTPAVTQWPCFWCEEGYRAEPVDWLARTPLNSPLAVWLSTDTCRPVPKPKHKFTFIWKEGKERYTQDKSCCISTVQCQGLSTVQDSCTNGPWRKKFSLPLEQLKGVS